MPALKIGFIQPINTETFGLNISTQNSLSFGYLKGYLDKYLPQEDIEYKVLNDITQLQDEKVDILGVSAYTPFFYHCNKTIIQAREYDENMLIVLGGHHITLAPEDLPDEADIGVIGEGEQTFLEIVEMYSKLRSKKTLKSNLHNINGIVFKDNRELIITRMRAKIQPLDKIPFSDKTIFPPFKSFVGNVSSFKTYTAISPQYDDAQAVYLTTSRGCPFDCTFCSARLVADKSFRNFTADYVINEIIDIIKRFPNVNYIGISDDTFGVDRQRLREIVDKAERLGITKKVLFVAAIRSNLVDEEFCELLARLNVRNVAFGAESGSKRILGLLKYGVTIEDNQRACNLLSRYGISAGCTCILGTPSETEEEMQATFDFILNNIIEDNISIVNIAILTPFPGTPWWDYAIDQGWVDAENMNWTRLDNMFINCFPYGGRRTYDQWRAERENYGIYLNKHTIPEKRFYDLLGNFIQKSIPVIVKKVMP